MELIEQKCRELLDKGQYSEALSYINSQAIPVKYILLSLYHYRSEEFHLSLEFARKAYAEIINNEKIGLKLRSISRLSESLQRLGMYEEALNLLQSHSNLVQNNAEAEDPYSQTWISHYYYQFAICCSQGLADYKSGLEYFEKSEKIRRSLNNKKLISHCLNGKAVTLERMGNLQDALQCYKQTLVMKEKNTVSYAITLSNIGGLYSNLGNIKIAREHYTEAKEIFLRENNISHLIVVEELLGYIAKEENKLDIATQHYEQAYFLAKILKVNKDIGYTLKKLITLNLALEKDSVAEKLFDEFKQLVIDNKFHQFENDIKLLHALILRRKPRVKNKVQALDLFHEVLKTSTNYEIIFSSMLNIVELLIEEYISYSDEEDRIYVLSEIDKVFSVFEFEIERLNSDSFRIQSIRIRAKIAGLLGKTKLCKDLYQKAYSMAESMNLHKLANKISEDLDKNDFVLQKSDVDEIRQEYILISVHLKEQDADDFYSLLSSKYDPL